MTGVCSHWCEPGSGAAVTGRRIGRAARQGGETSLGQGLLAFQPLVPLHYRARTGTVTTRAWRRDECDPQERTLPASRGGVTTRAWRRDECDDVLLVNEYNVYYVTTRAWTRDECDDDGERAA